MHIIIEHKEWVSTLCSCKLDTVTWKNRLAKNYPCVLSVLVKTGLTQPKIFYKNIEFWHNPMIFSDYMHNIPIHKNCVHHFFCFLRVKTHPLIPKWDGRLWYSHNMLVIVMIHVPIWMVTVSWSLIAVSLQPVFRGTPSLHHLSTSTKNKVTSNGQGHVNYKQHWPNTRSLQRVMVI